MNANGREIIKNVIGVSLTDVGLGLGALIGLLGLTAATIVTKDQNKTNADIKRAAFVILDEMEFSNNTLTIKLSSEEIKTLRQNIESGQFHDTSSFAQRLMDSGKATNHSK